MSISVALNLLADNFDFPAQNLMDVESLKQWLKQYSYEVFINPTESPLKVKNTFFMPIEWCPSLIVS